MAKLSEMKKFLHFRWVLALQKHFFLVTLFQGSKV